MKKNKKILIITNMYPSVKYPHYGIFVKHCAEILENAGYYVAVESMKKTDSKIIKLFVYMLFYLRSVCRMIFGGYDAVYAHFASHTALPLLIAKKIRKKIPIIMNVHGNDVVADTERDKKYFGIVKKILSASDRVVCPSDYFRDVLIKDFSVTEKKIIVYPSGGVDTDFFKRLDRNKALDVLKLSDKNKYIAYVSRIEKDKGWDIFLEAGKKFIEKHTEFRIIIAGDGSSANEYEALCRELGMNEKIIKYPLLSHEMVRCVYNAADIFVFPTYRKSESLGLVGLEAMACEAVTILPDKYGPSGYGENMVNSIVFRSQSADDLFRAMNYAAENDCSYLGKTGRKTAVKYNHSNTDKIIIKCFEELFSGGVNR